MLIKCNLFNEQKLSYLIKWKGYLIKWKSYLIKWKGYLMSQFSLAVMDKESSKLEMIIISSKNIYIKQAFI